MFRKTFKEQMSRSFELKESSHQGECRRAQDSSVFSQAHLQAQDMLVGSASDPRAASHKPMASAGSAHWGTRHSRVDRQF